MKEEEQKRCKMLGRDRGKRGERTKGQNMLFCTFLGLSPACTQNRGAEGSRAKTCRQKRNKGSVRKVVAQRCRGNGEGPAPRNPGRNTLPKASNEHLPCLGGRKKRSC